QVGSSRESEADEAALGLGRAGVVSPETDIGTIAQGEQNLLEQLGLAGRFVWRVHLVGSPGRRASWRSRSGGALGPGAGRQRSRKPAGKWGDSWKVSRYRWKAQPGL